MDAESRESRAALSRRDMFRTGGTLAAGLAAAVPAASVPAAAESPDVYTRIGVRPFINCTATLTINGGSLTLPEVISTVEQASHYHVNLDELMEKVGDRLAQLLEVEWGIVTDGAAAALTHATAGCIAGTDPEKMQRLPNLAGLKDEVIMPRESRVVYDHAVRAVGVKIVEVDTAEDVRKAISPHTAMIEMLGEHFGGARLDLKSVAPIARQAGVPILIDAAADYLIVPNPYLTQGADMVAYSGGKIIRGPQNAGLLIGRRQLVRAAWANSAPHHAVGRTAKVGKEQIVGMLRAVEIWRTERDIQQDFKLWESWYAEMSQQIGRAPGVKAEVRGPVRGGPFLTLNVSWDPARVPITAGEVGRLLLEGEPRIMTHAEGGGHAFLIRPVAMKPGEYSVVARRLYEVLSSAKAPPPAAPPAPPVLDLSGEWEVEIEYEAGSAQHSFFLNARGNSISGSHQGWAFRGALAGQVDGPRVRLGSSLPAGGTRLSYLFTGSITSQSMAGDVNLGEYGKARWHAKLVRGRA